MLSIAGALQWGVGALLWEVGALLLLWEVGTLLWKVGASLLQWEVGTLLWKVGTLLLLWKVGALLWEDTIPSSLGQSRSPDSEETWSVQAQIGDISEKLETAQEIWLRVIQNQPTWLWRCIFLSYWQIPKIVRPPETRPISQEQLVAEVKGIYAGLVMVEGKCIKVDAKQAAIAREAPAGEIPKLSNEQWQALIALHRTLLHEFHDFFLASQHPSATPAVRRLAIKYAMPARLWRHGIHSFLEVLRSRLPDSLDHMLAFIYLAYSIMTLLFETVPAFEETWIECLGDLGRYRMAIEDDDIRDRIVWTQVSRHWYLKASNGAPEVGRLYHHLAILARPNPLQQLCFYGKSLSVSQPFLKGKNSFLTLLEPILSDTPTGRLPQFITVYIRIHAFLFMRKNIESFGGSLNEFISLLDSHISHAKHRFLEQGYYIAISNCLALLSYGSLDSVLSKASAEDIVSTNETQTGTPESPADPFTEATELFVQTLDTNCKRIEDPNVLSFLHATLIFLLWVARFPAAMQLLEKKIFWGSLVHKLNYLLRSYHLYSRIEGDELPMLDKKNCRPTPEEFAMRGLKWADQHSPRDWFKNIEDENQYKEKISMNTDYRPERVLWFGIQLSQLVKGFTYDNKTHTFLLEPVQADIPILEAVSSDLELSLGAESTTVTAAEIPYNESKTTLVEVKETKEAATRTCNSCIQGELSCIPWPSNRTLINNRVP
jgi:hypothetical protein